MNRVAEALQLDSDPGSHSLDDYKRAFTSQAVKKIHEAVLEFWPPGGDIREVLQRSRREVSGLYIGDYRTKYLSKGIVRHSIYATKLLVVDPFVYATAVQDEYNPILRPDQYRVQTLKNVNLWFSLLPWIEAGIVEVIRTPGDFDARLNWESLHRQQRKFEENEVLKEAADQSATELSEREGKELIRLSLLTAPNEHLERIFQESGLEERGISAATFIEYVERQRARDHDFLGPLGPGGLPEQLHMFSSGANYEMASITADLTGSYLVTDIHSKWKEVEIDREQYRVRRREWEPFAKALQGLDLRCLNSLSLEHALILRSEEHLESIRTFLRGVWKSAMSGEPFDEANARFLGEELKDEIRRAEEEWKAIDRRLLRWFGAELGAELLAAGPLIASGHGAFLAAAVAVSGAVHLGASRSERKGFPVKFPAAFFLRLE